MPRIRKVRLAPGLIGHFASPPERLRRRRERELCRKTHRRLKALGQLPGRGRADRPGAPPYPTPISVTPRGERLTAIDIFAGLGGMSVGAEMGGLNVTWAVNHWVEAVHLHKQNMPHAEHPPACDAGEIRNWGIAPRHDVMMAGPSCKGFTKAGGKKIHSEEYNKYRATMWTVVEAAWYHKPRYLVVENVPEAMDWNQYPAWRLALELDGYVLTENILNAPDFGAGMNRERLFVVGVLNGPELRIHAPSDVGPRPWSDFITWDSPEHDWAPIDPWLREKIPGKNPLEDRWYEVILRTYERSGKKMKRFVIPYFGSTKYGYGIDRPLGSITTATRYVMIDMDKRMMRWPHPREKALSMGFPKKTILPRTATAGHEMLGNAVAPLVMKSIAEQIRAHHLRYG